MPTSMHSCVTINGIEIGVGSQCFITFEAGPTHQGLESAKRLADFSKQAGAHAIKFQILDPIRLVADPLLPFRYEVLVNSDSGAREIVEEPLLDILKRRSMQMWEWRELKRYCDDLGLAFFSTACFNDEIDFLVDLGCQSIKIASADINHLPLISHAAKTGLCIQMDTGMASLGEIEVAVDTIRSCGNNKIIIHHCPSGYPASPDKINLRSIPMIQHLFGCPVAFSDHTPGWQIDIAALAMGADMLEKTITENRLIRSVEHIMSLEPQEMKAFVQTIQEIELALGEARRSLTPPEMERRTAIRRSLFLAHDLQAGHQIREEDIEYRRPGIGISPDCLQKVLKRFLLVDKSAGSMLTWTDLD